MKRHIFFTLLWDCSHFGPQGVGAVTIRPRLGDGRIQ
jgi:hypothetical protein